MRPETEGDEKLTKAQLVRVHLAIHTTAGLAAAVGAGLAQLPCSDAAALAPVEAAMVVSIASAFGIRLNQASAEATLAGATATLCGRGLSQIAVGWLPGFGNACNALTAAITVQLVGWAAAADFDHRANGPAKGKGEEKDDGKKGRKPP